ncbi:MAG: FtsX-like permease family protein [Alphaproteobacteria bacterium]|nr:FtsX-like permease family protein [Alphaproteobacteria bacterium]
MNALAAAWRLTRRELRGGFAGFRTFIACLALGVAAIAGIGTVSKSVIDGIERDARAILGGDVSLRLTHREATDMQRAWLADNGTVTRAVTMRAMAHAAEGGARSLIELKAVDGRYPLFGALKLDGAAAAPAVFDRRDGRWGAVVEPGVMTRLGLKIGDPVRVGDAVYTVRAVIRHEPDRAGGGALTLGPRVMVGEDSLAETGLIRPGAQLRYYYRVRLPDGVALADWKRRLDAAFPEAGWRVNDRTNAAPGVRRFVDRMTQYLTLVGLTALLIGGVGVGNAVRAYLGGKTGVIATLKCVGAPGRVIFLTYLMQVLVMAGCGIGIGIAIGALVPLGLGRLLAGALPVPLDIGFDAAPLALAAAFGLLVALAFSLWPIARACAVPAAALFRDLVAPADARPGWRVVAATALSVAALAGLAIAGAYERNVAVWFVAGAAAAFAVFLAAGWAVKRLARAVHGVRSARLRMALANLHRPGSQTAAIVLSLGMGLTVLVAVALVEGNIAREIRETVPSRAPGFYFVDIQPDQVEAFERTVRAVPGVQEVRRVPMLRGRIVAVNGVAADRLSYQGRRPWVLRSDRGLTWAGPMPEGTEMVAGDWWPADYSGPPLISLSADEARDIGVGLGDTLTVDILGRPVTATIASLREIDWRSFRINFVVMFSPGVIEGAPQTHIATVRAEDGAEDAIERAVTDRFANVTSIRVSDVLRTVNDMMDKIATAIRLTAAITLLAGTLVLAGAMAAGHRRRVYDAVVLKVLGARRREILATFLLEYGLMGAATTVIAAAVGTVAGWAVIARVMKTSWEFMPEAVALTAVVCAVLTLGLGLVGTWRALGQKAAPILRNE